MSINATKYSSDGSEKHNVWPLVTIPVLPTPPAACEKDCIIHDAQRGSGLSKPTTKTLSTAESTESRPTCIRNHDEYRKKGLGENAEAMHVFATVYSLDGLIRRKKTRKSRRKRKEKRDSMKEGRSNCAAPTTAVVSAKREVSNSGFAIQTFLPSLELRVHPASPNNQNEVRCTAYWPSDSDDNASCSPLGVYEYQSSSTILMIRIMERETFRRDARIGQVPHFAYEKIDLNVSIGRGKEIIPLGVASIVVSGEEEAEVVTNVPVKPLPLTVSPRRLRKKNNTRPKTFEDEQFIYSLEDNATLRVGMRVIPSGLQEAEESLDRIFEQCQEEEQKKKIIHLEDDKALILGRLESHKEDDDVVKERAKQLLCKQTMERTPEDTGIEPSSNFFFSCICPSLCSTIQEDLIRDDSGDMQQQLPPTIITGRPSALTKKGPATATTEAIVLPLHAMSDVSESLYESEEESNAADKEGLLGF